MTIAEYLAQHLDWTEAEKLANLLDWRDHFVEKTIQDDQWADRGREIYVLADGSGVFEKHRHDWRALSAEDIAVITNTVPQ